MKKNLSVIAALFVVAFTPALRGLHAQKAFEGTITWSMTMPMMGSEDSHSMIINVKGNKSETEMDMGGMGVVKTYVDNDAKKIYTVMGAMKTGYVADMGDKKAAQKQLSSIGLKASGQKATINGHPAEEYLLTGVNMRGMNVDISIWVTADFPKELQETFYRSLNNNPGQDPKQTAAMRQLADKGLVPVRILMKKDGEVAMTMDFVKYEQKSLADALFVPPADVKFSSPPKAPGGGMN